MVIYMHFLPKLLLILVLLSLTIENNGEHEEDKCPGIKEMDKCNKEEKCVFDEKPKKCMKIEDKCKGIEDRNNCNKEQKCAYDITSSKCVVTADKCPAIKDKDQCDKEDKCAYNPEPNTCIVSDADAKKKMQECYKNKEMAYDVKNHECVKIKEYCVRQTVETCFNGTFASCVYEVSDCIILKESCAIEKDPNNCIRKCIWSILDKKCVNVADYCMWNGSHGQLPCETLWMCKWADGKCQKKYNY